MVRSFILPQRQDRYLELLANPKRRNQITAGLAHFKHLDPRFAFLVPSEHRLAPGLFRLLKSKEAPDHCYLLSEDPDVDGKEMLLVEALNFVIGRGIGTFVSCIPGRLAYFEDEDQRWILERADER